MSDYLLDTHVFLWWASGSAKISRSHRDILASPASADVWLSAVSAWEATIKAATGKLRLPGPPFEFFSQACAKYGFKILNVHLSHATGVSQLPPLHTDPFDRLLISQARCERFILLTDDVMIRQYRFADLTIH